LTVPTWRMARGRTHEFKWVAGVCSVLERSISAKARDRGQSQPRMQAYDRHSRVLLAGIQVWREIQVFSSIRTPVKDLRGRRVSRLSYKFSAIHYPRAPVPCNRRPCPPGNCPPTAPGNAVDLWPRHGEGETRSCRRPPIPASPRLRVSASLCLRVVSQPY
jgi:hypothetical protein